MNPSLLISLSLLLLLAFSAHSAPTDPIIDIDGNPIRIGVEYYILPVVRGRGGGLTLSGLVDSTQKCPPRVMQDRNELARGQPITFSSINGKKGPVRVSTDYYVSFAPFDNTTTPPCGAKSFMWSTAYDDSTRQFFVTVGAVVEPGILTVSNLFKIEQHESGYKLMSCPSVCQGCGCRNFGISIDKEGTRRLALSDERPFMLTFRKVY